jgi:hypothetical protein
MSKSAFRSRAKANRARIKQAAMTDVRMQVYGPCSDCGMWHLTSQPRGEMGEGADAYEPEAIYARPMADQREFFVSYAGAMTPHDREALARTERKIYKNEGGGTGRWQGEGKPFVRLRANDAEEAMRLVAEAIGRRPPGLRAREAKSRE